MANSSKVILKRSGEKNQQPRLSEEMLSKISNSQTKSKFKKSQVTLSSQKSSIGQQSFASGDFKPLFVIKPQILPRQKTIKFKPHHGLKHELTIQECMTASNLNQIGAGFDTDPDSHHASNSNSLKNFNLCNLRKSSDNPQVMFSRGPTIAIEDSFSAEEPKLLQKHSSQISESKQAQHS